MPAKPFPTEVLSIDTATLYDQNGLTIICQIAPFRHADAAEDDGTSMGFDPLNTRGRLSDDLIGTTLTFPTNPAPGYWEGSIVIDHAHIPLDVTQAAFTLSDPETLCIHLTAQMAFDPGVPFTPTPWTFDLHLPVTQFDDILSGRSKAQADAAKQARLARKLAQKRKP